MNIPSFAMPIGISFYTLQAVSYCFDVYRGKIPADRNLFRLALFMSFFPQIMEGPICRYGDTAHQLWAVPPIRWRTSCLGGAAHPLRFDEKGGGGRPAEPLYSAGVLRICGV